MRNDEKNGEKFIDKKRESCYNLKSQSVGRND